MKKLINLLETTKTQIILNQIDHKSLIFTPLTKEEHDDYVLEVRRFLSFPKNSKKRQEVKEELLRYSGIDFEGIVAVGDTTMETRLANTYIESVKTTVNGLPKNSYKCFVNNDWKTINRNLNLPYHEDGGCSWNCLMEKLKYPKFGIIYYVSSKLEINKS